jgi:hypothetical protein
VQRLRDKPSFLYIVLGINKVFRVHEKARIGHIAALSIEAHGSIDECCSTPIKCYAINPVAERRTPMSARDSRECDGMYDPKLAKMQQRFRETGETTPRVGLELDSYGHRVDRKRAIESEDQARKRSSQDRC